MRALLLFALLTGCAGESIVHQYECPEAPPAVSCEREAPDVPRRWVCDGALTATTLIGGYDNPWQQDDVDRACSCIGTRPGGYLWTCDANYDARTDTWGDPSLERAK